MMEVDLSRRPPGGDQQDRLEPSVAHHAHLRGFGAALVAEGHGGHRHLRAWTIRRTIHPTPTLTNGWSTEPRQREREMGHVRFGITWIPDDDFEQMVAERERLLSERDARLATDGG